MPSASHDPGEVLRLTDANLCRVFPGREIDLVGRQRGDDLIENPGLDPATDDDGDGGVDEGWSLRLAEMTGQALGGGHVAESGLEVALLGGQAGFDHQGLRAGDRQARVGEDRPVEIDAAHRFLGEQADRPNLIKQQAFPRDPPGGDGRVPSILVIEFGRNLDYLGTARPGSRRVVLEALAEFEPLEVTIPLGGNVAHGDGQFGIALDKTLAEKIGLPSQFLQAGLVARILGAEQSQEMGAEFRARGFPGIVFPTQQFIEVLLDEIVGPREGAAAGQGLHRVLWRARPLVGSPGMA